MMLSRDVMLMLMETMQVILLMRKYFSYHVKEVMLMILYAAQVIATNGDLCLSDD